MFGEYGEGFLSGWFNFIVLGFLFILGLWVLSGIFNSKPGRWISRVLDPVVRKYESLPFNSRRFIGGLTFTAYCLGMLLIFILTTH